MAASEQGTHEPDLGTHAPIDKRDVKGKKKAELRNGQREASKLYDGGCVEKPRKGSFNAAGAREDGGGAGAQGQGTRVPEEAPGSLRSQDGPT